MGFSEGAGQLAHLRVGFFCFSCFHDGDAFTVRYNGPPLQTLCCGLARGMALSLSWHSTSPGDLIVFASLHNGDWQSPSNLLCWWPRYLASHSTTHPCCIQQPAVLLHGQPL